MEYLMRSLMFVPAHKGRVLKSAVASDADVLLPDLEDSVHPSDNKQLARQNIVQFVSAKKFEGHHVFPRVNDRESGELLKDIQTLSIDGIDGFMYPKSQTGQDIYFFDKLLETVEYEKGIEPGTFKIIPLVETAAAVWNASEICSASDRVVAIAFGCEDYLTDLHGSNDDEASTLDTPRNMIAIAARANNVIPIDTVHIRVHDLDDLEKNLKIAQKLGFEGMLVLHPKELSLVHQYFSPTKEEVEAAEKMLHSFSESQKEGTGVAIVDGQFVGPPLVRKAQKILDKHNLIKQLN